jgi:hypothetical protein
VAVDVVPSLHTAPVLWSAGQSELEFAVFEQKSNNAKTDKTSIRFIFIALLSINLKTIRF